MATIHIDEAGRLLLPADIMRSLGLRPDEDVVGEVLEEGLLIRAPHREWPITARIAAMNLPVSDWEEMEGGIEAGRGA